MQILGVYLVDFGQNVGGEISGKRPAIVISKKSPKDKTFLVVPITSKKSGTKYRGGFTIDNLKYLPTSKYKFGFAKVRKIREVSINRIASDKRFTLDAHDTKKLVDSLKDVIIPLSTP